MSPRPNRFNNMGMISEVPERETGERPTDSRLKRRRISEAEILGVSEHVFERWRFIYQSR